MRIGLFALVFPASVLKVCVSLSDASVGSFMKTLRLCLNWLFLLIINVQGGVFKETL